MFAAAALGLAIIQGAAFALVSPDNNFPRGVDHWFYPYLGDRIWREADVFFSFSGRQFSTWGLALAQGLFPGNFASIFYLHVASVWVFAVTIYLILCRLFPQHKLFAFLSAAVYLVYVPFNSEHTLYWLELYSWTLMFGGFAVIAFLEYAYRPGSRWRWFWLGAACLLAYIAARGYEAFMPLLALVPLLHPIRQRDMTRGAIVGVGLWWAAIGIGFLQFMIPYLRGDPSIAYQQSVDAGDGESVVGLAENTLEFVGHAFPLTSIVRDFEIGSVLFPVLMTASLLVVAFIFLRYFSAQSQEFSTRQLALIAAAGLLMTLAGGVGFIYGDLQNVPRAQGFAAPGQALVIVGLLAMIARGVARISKIPQHITLAVLAGLLMFVAGQWFFAHDSLYSAYSVRQQRAPYRDLIEIVPGVADETLLLNYQCVTRPREDPYHSQLINGFAVRYLYDHTGGSGVQMAVLEYLTFDETGVTFADRIVTDPTPPHHYRYDQLLIVACVDGGLQIVDSFPEGWMAMIETYDPHARITEPRISATKLQILEP